MVNNFNGGAPSSRDEVPAIIFAVAVSYLVLTLKHVGIEPSSRLQLGLTIPLLLYRIIAKKHRTWILSNAVLFFILRTAALGIRAYRAKHEYSDATLGKLLANDWNDAIHASRNTLGNLLTLLFATPSCRIDPHLNILPVPYQCSY